MTSLSICSVAQPTSPYCADYSQCIPGAAAPSASPTSPSSAPTPAPSGALPRLGGVNTAGYDFSVVCIPLSFPFRPTLNGLFRLPMEASLELACHRPHPSTLTLHLRVPIYTVFVSSTLHRNSTLFDGDFSICMAVNDAHPWRLNRLKLLLSLRPDRASCSQLWS